MTEDPLRAESPTRISCIHVYFEVYAYPLYSSIAMSLNKISVVREMLLGTYVILVFRERVAYRHPTRIAGGRNKKILGISMR